jgi:lipoprotein NlpD
MSHSEFLRFASFGSVLLTLLLAGCATKSPAPVSDRRPPAAAASAVTAPPTPASKPQAATGDAKPSDAGRTHTVQKGETLIGIALQYGLDYRELAMWNNIDNPNVIKVDSVLRVTPPGAMSSADSATASGSGTSKDPKPGLAVATPLITTPMPSAAGERPPVNAANSKVEPKGGKVPYSDQAYERLSRAATAATPTPQPAASTGTALAPGAPATAPSTTGTPPAPSVAAASAVAATASATSDDVEWSWPVKGKVIANFTEANKGIDIAGSKGTPVLAAAPGKVVYANSGLRGYGRLVIIKHNNTWLSAYAHNEKILVAEGQEVKRGQPVAEMGSSDADQVKLHFEVRKNGKPLDPAKFLPAR